MEVAEEGRGRAMAFGLDLKAQVNTRRTMLADPALIKRAVSNLLDNAMKYTPSGARSRLAWTSGPTRSS